MIGALVAAVMAASFFLPWLIVFGEPVGPQLLFEDGFDAVLELPWQVLVFLSSFVVAAVAALVAFSGRSAGLLMMIAGAIPFGLIAQQFLGVRNQIAEVGFEMPNLDDPMADPVGALNNVREILEIGPQAYFVSAALLILIGLVRLMRGT